MYRYGKHRGIPGVALLLKTISPNSPFAPRGYEMLCPPRIVRDAGTGILSVKAALAVME